MRGARGSYPARAIICAPSSGISLADLVTRREVQEVAQRQDLRRCNGRMPQLDKIEASAIE